MTVRGWILQTGERKPLSQSLSQNYEESSILEQEYFLIVLPQPPRAQPACMGFSRFCTALCSRLGWEKVTGPKSLLYNGAVGIWTWISAFLVDHANHYTRWAPPTSWLLWANHYHWKSSNIRGAIPDVLPMPKNTSQLYKHQHSFYYNFLGMKAFLSS